MIQEGTWYVLHDAQQSKASIPTGFTQATAYDKESSGAWVWVDNHTTKDIHINQGDTVAIATPEVPGTFEVRLRRVKVDEEDVEIDYSKWTETELDEAMVRVDTTLGTTEHVKELPLLTETQPHLSKTEVYRLKRVILKYNRLWSTENKDSQSLGNVTCNIKMKKPFKGQGGLIPMSPVQRAAFNKIIKEQLDMGIIEPSKAGVSSPVFLVPKPGGDSFRLVQDFRALNKCIDDDQYPLPVVEEQLASIGKCKYFTSLDMMAAFWQVRLDEDSRDATSFKTPMGLFRFTRLPMGLKSASSVFCRFLGTRTSYRTWTMAQSRAQHSSSTLHP